MNKSASTSTTTTTIIPAAPATKADASKTKTITCSFCKVVKEYADFSKSQLERRLKRKATGVGKCKECVRDYDRNRRYKITPAMINQRLLEQNSKCALSFCEEKITIASCQVDHDHDTNKIRGLLCVGCNTSLGGLGDKIDKLLMAACYLAKDEKDLTPQMLQNTNRSMETLNTWHKLILKQEAEKSTSTSLSTSTSESTKIK